MAKMMFFVLVSEPCVGMQKNSASNFIDVFYISQWTLHWEGITQEHGNFISISWTLESSPYFYSSTGWSERKKA